MAKVKAHFVTFYSPGTLFAETTEMPIASWDVEAAKVMVKKVKERYGAVPYGFEFTTRGRGQKDLDSKVIATSPFYYLGGTIETLVEVKARNKPEERILVGNMEGNGWDRIIVNNNSWRSTHPLKATDVILSWP